MNYTKLLFSCLLVITGTALFAADPFRKGAKGAQSMLLASPSLFGSSSSSTVGASSSSSSSASAPALSFDQDDVGDNADASDADEESAQESEQEGDDDDDEEESKAAQNTPEFLSPPRVKRLYGRAIKIAGRVTHGGFLTQAILQHNCARRLDLLFPPSPTRSSSSAVEAQHATQGSAHSCSGQLPYASASSSSSSSSSMLAPLNSSSLSSSSSSSAAPARSTWSSAAAAASAVDAHLAGRACVDFEKPELSESEEDEKPKAAKHAKRAPAFANRRNGRSDDPDCGPDRHKFCHRPECRTFFPSAKAVQEHAIEEHFEPNQESFPCKYNCKFVFDKKEWLDDHYDNPRSDCGKRLAPDKQ